MRQGIVKLQSDREPPRITARRFLDESLVLEEPGSQHHHAHSHVHELFKARLYQVEALLIHQAGDHPHQRLITVDQGKAHLSEELDL